MNRRRRLWLLVTAGAVIAAGVVAWRARPPELPRVPIGLVVVASTGGGRDLRVHLTYSSCKELARLSVDEHLHSVRLTAIVHDLVSCGTVDTTSQVVPVRLERPLRGRPVVDGSTGTPLAVAS